MNINEHFQIETSTCSGLRDQDKYLDPMQVCCGKIQVCGGGGGGWCEGVGWGMDGVGHKSKSRDRGILLLKITFVNFTGFGLA